MGKTVVPADPLAWIQIGAGGVLLLIGLWVVAWKRRLWRAIWRTPPRDDTTPQGASLRPTRLVVGVVLLLAGYHIAAWAVPPDVVPVQLNRAWWWVWAGAGVLAIAGSMGIDRLDRP